MSYIRLDAYLSQCVSKEIAGIVCWIGTTQTTLFCKSYGLAQRIPDRVRMHESTIFDLASLTKPFVTATALMMLVEKGVVCLQDKVQRFLPQFNQTVNGRVTIYDLLTHTAGLPAWFPLYLLPPGTRMSFLANTNTGKGCVEYSCLGYIILGMLIEKVSGTSLNLYSRHNIFLPAGLKSMTFCPGTRRNIAATEKGNSYEKQMAKDYGDISKTQWRKRVIRGEVHDGNCFYAYKGIAGNAGLFGNAKDCGCFLQLYCRGEFVNIRSVNQMIRAHTDGPEKRGLGWWIDPYPEFLSPRTFAHTGFTGTMVCVDPERDMIIVLLTNAIHPYVQQPVKKKVRRKVVQLAAHCEARNA